MSFTPRDLVANQVYTNSDLLDRDFTNIRQNWKLDRGYHVWAREAERIIVKDHQDGYKFIFAYHIPKVPSFPDLNDQSQGGKA